MAFLFKIITSKNENMYGKITVGTNTTEQRELEIIEFVQSKFKNNRVISISKIEDGSIVGSVENPLSTGRNVQSSIWLSKESFIGLVSTAMLYLNIKGEDLEKLLKDSLDGKNIEYSFSENLSKK